MIIILTKLKKVKCCKNKYYWYFQENKSIKFFYEKAFDKSIGSFTDAAV